MALLFMDGFDHYQYSIITQKWTWLTGTGFFNTGTAYGQRGTQGLRMWSTSGLNSQSDHLYKVVAATGATFVCGFAWKQVTPLSRLFATFPPLLVRCRQGGTDQVLLRLNVDGTLTALCGATVLQTSSFVVVQGVDYYVEMKVVLHATTGTCVVKFNGSEVINFTGDTLNTASATWDEMRIGPTSATAGVLSEWWYDDFYLLDGSGAAPLNDFLGPVQVDARYPTAEGALSEWTPSAGTDNALMVDDPLPDGDTTNVTSVTALTDTHVLQDSPQPGKLIYAVQLYIQSKKSDIGPYALNAIVRQAGANHLTLLQGTGAAYEYRSVKYSNNPATGLPWTEAEFNAAEFGYGRTL